jgi:hypothetical protein
MVVVWRALREPGFNHKQWSRVALREHAFNQYKHLATLISAQINTTEPEESDNLSLSSKGTAFTITECLAHTAITPLAAGKALSIEEHQFRADCFQK